MLKPWISRSRIPSGSGRNSWFNTSCLCWWRPPRCTACGSCTAAARQWWAGNIGRIWAVNGLLSGIALMDINGIWWYESVLPEMGKILWTFIYKWSNNAISHYIFGQHDNGWTMNFWCVTIFCSLSCISNISISFFSSFVGGVWLIFAEFCPEFHEKFHWDATSGISNSCATG